MRACICRDQIKRRFTDIWFAAPMSECYLRPCCGTIFLIGDLFEDENSFKCLHNLYM